MKEFPATFQDIADESMMKVWYKDPQVGHMDLESIRPQEVEFRWGVGGWDWMGFQ